MLESRHTNFTMALSVNIMKTFNTSRYDSELWIADKKTGVNLRKDLLSFGVLLAKERGVKIPDCEENIFKLNSRVFHITNRIERKVKKQTELLNIIFKMSSNIFVPDESKVISNKNRREEIFLPVININNNINFYAYPWTYKKNELPDNFNGFERYVSAVCMFGSDLKGSDNHDAKIVLIKHGIKFYRDQKIERMNLDQEYFNFYEEVLKFELKKLSSFIAETSKKNTEEILISIHLPYYDYILFVIDLFLDNKLSDFALAEFAEIMMKAVPRYEKFIKEEFSNTQYNIKICSPFDSIFGNLIHTAEDSCDLLFKMFDIIGIELDSEMNFSPEEKQLLTDKMLNKLQASVYPSDSDQKSIWKSIIDCKGAENIRCLEDLLQLGNSVIPMTAAFRSKPFDTCSVLPVTEKQIQVSHEDYSRKLDHPPAFYLTFLDSMIGHNFSSENASSSAAVSAFYFNSQNSGDLKNFIQEDRVLIRASENIETSSAKTHKKNLGDIHEEPSLSNNNFKLFKEKEKKLEIVVLESTCLSLYSRN